MQEVFAGMWQPQSVTDTGQGLALTAPEAVGTAAEYGWEQLSSDRALASVLPGQTCMLQMHLLPTVLAHAASEGGSMLLEVRTKPIPAAHSQAMDRC